MPQAHHCVFSRTHAINIHVLVYIHAYRYSTRGSVGRQRDPDCPRPEPEPGRDKYQEPVGPSFICFAIPFHFPTPPRLGISASPDPSGSLRICRPRPLHTGSVILLFSSHLILTTCRINSRHGRNIYTTYNEIQEQHLGMIDLSASNMI